MPRVVQGSAASPIAAIGIPGSRSTLATLWRNPVHRRPARVGGPRTGSARRVGGSLQAKMSAPLSESAFVSACPGRGLPNTTQLRTAHGANTIIAGTAAPMTSRNHPRAPAPDLCAMPRDTISQPSANQAASLRVSAASPRSTPRANARGSANRAPRGSRAIRAASRHTARMRAANGIVESGRTEWRTRGRNTAAVSPVPSANVRARPGGIDRSAATSAASRQASTATRAPTAMDDHWATANVAPRTTMGIAARKDGSGSHTSNAGRGNVSGGVPKLQIASVTRPRPVTRLWATPT